MQTFLPYDDFSESAAVLDRQRLGKQRVECLQILNALCIEGYGWASHPAVLMWRGHERVLVRYAEAICDEWTSRGYRDTCRVKIAGRLEEFLTSGASSSDEAPSWLGDEDLHRSHRSNLLRKEASWYGPLFEEGLRDDLDYVWPVRAEVA